MDGTGEDPDPKPYKGLSTSGFRTSDPSSPSLPSRANIIYLPQGVEDFRGGYGDREVVIGKVRRFRVK